MTSSDTIIVRRRRWTVAFVAALGLFAAGCGASSSTSVEERVEVARPLPAPPSIGPPMEEAPDEGADPDGVMRVEPYEGNVNEPYPVSWDQVRIDVEAQTMTLRYVAGAQPCTVLASVEVDYDDEAVVATVLLGTPDEAATMTCIAAAFTYEVTVELAEPVGTRSVVDGADA